MTIQWYSKKQAKSQVVLGVEIQPVIQHPGDWIKRTEFKSSLKLHSGLEASLVYTVHSRLAKATLLVIREVQTEDTMRHRSFLYGNSTSSSTALGRREWESWNPVHYSKNTNQSGCSKTQAVPETYIWPSNPSSEFIPKTTENRFLNGREAHICNPNTWEAKAEGLEIHCYLQLRASLRPA